MAGEFRGVVRTKERRRVEGVDLVIVEGARGVAYVAAADYGEAESRLQARSWLSLAVAHAQRAIHVVGTV